MSLLTTHKDLFINMTDIPKYVPGKHFFEQSAEVIDFWTKEKDKLTYGLTLDGFFIHPWLYYHMNFFKTPIPTINDRGVKAEVPKVPVLTDNTFLFVESYQEAEERGMGVCMFGSRGVFKSTHLASVSSWLAMAKPYGVVSITGGNKEDLHNISRLLGVTFNKMHPALQMNRLISDWTEKVEFGWMENNQEKFVQSIISVTNEAGGVKSKSEKGAGPSPVGYIKDEIGKYDFLESYGAALESFYTADGMKLVPLLTGTSGNEKLSADAKKLLSNPESYGIIPMNWDNLERGIDPDDITWNSSKKKPFGTFMPGQMTGRYGAPKVESNLAKYLGLDEKTSELKHIKINVTDWKASKDKIQARIDEKKDKSEKDRLRMYYPMNTEDCFLTKGKNPFPVNIIRRHKERLIENGNFGREIELIKEGSSVKEVSTEKQRIKFPHDGTEHDGPLIVFGKVPQTSPPSFQNVAGLDDYKLDIAKTSDSAGALYVLRRRFQDMNSPAETIVCCLNDRPGRHEDFYKKVEDVLETWNAQCLIEAVDVGIVQHLRLRGKVDKLLYPELSYAPSADNRNRFKSGKYGMYPHEYNVKYRMNKVVDAMKEEYTVGFDDDGRPIIKYGVEFIDDIDLLTEMEEYYPGGNFDKLTAFSHALVLARQLDDDNVRAQDETSQKQEYLKIMQARQQNTANRRINPYAGRRNNPYR